MLAHVESVVAEFSVYPVIAEVIRLSQAQLDVVRGGYYLVRRLV